MGDLLNELGWSKARLARESGLWPETVSRWQSPPKWVIAYLEALVELKRLKFKLKELSEWQ